MKPLLLAATMLMMPCPGGASPRVVSEDVPVPGGTAALARAIGIEAPERARFVAEIVRLVYIDSRHFRNETDSRFRRLVAHLKVADGSDRARNAATADLVPIPLPAGLWSQAVFRRSVTAAGLFAAIMSDAAAALLAYGLAALDDETLQFLMDHPAVVTRLYERDACAFAAFAEQLHIHDNRVVPPGGDRAVPLWEAVLGAGVGQPDRFVRELFAKDEGRAAYLYDTIGHLDASRAAFALGLWIKDPGMRIDRFQALASAARSGFREWHAQQFPFKKPVHDLVSMFSRVQVDATGAPGFPAWRRTWARTFADADVQSDLKSLEDDTVIDAAWLAEAIGAGAIRSRMERLDQFAFGQRVFATADAAALPDVLVALRALPRFRMLMLTLERAGVRRPSVYAALVRQAQQLSGLDASQGHTALAQFQGAIALVSRLAIVRTIDSATAETLLNTLGAVPLNQHGRYAGGLAAWIQLQLRPALAPGDDMESVLIDALAGAHGPASASLVSWEGEQYRLDISAAEARRIHRIRERQSGCAIDVGLDLHAIAQTLAAHPAAAPVAEPLFELVDVLLGDALLSLSYAVDLGHADGTARLAGSVARRHDFGVAIKDDDLRVRTAWAIPKQVFKADVPWHVEGAALGLDIAFAPFALRRIHTDPLTRAPALNLLDVEAFATSLALMNPFALEDAARDAIADAVARGQRRVEGLAAGDLSAKSRFFSAVSAVSAVNVGFFTRSSAERTDLNALAREIPMDGWRVRALEWTIRHDPQRAGSFFSMTDLLYLGGGSRVDLSPWGMSALTSLGCICTHLVPPGHWTALVGRPQLGVLATTVADLNLRVAVMLRDMQLPAALARSVLAAAVQDFIDRVQPSDADDWLTLVRTAQSVSRERIEDFVAAATAGGPLLPEKTSTTADCRLRIADPQSEIRVPQCEVP